MLPSNSSQEPLITIVISMATTRVTLVYHPKQAFDKHVDIINLGKAVILPAPSAEGHNYLKNVLNQSITTDPPHKHRPNLHKSKSHPTVI